MGNVTTSLICIAVWLSLVVVNDLLCKRRGWNRRAWVGGTLIGGPLATLMLIFCKTEPRLL